MHITVTIFEISDVIELHLDNKIVFINKLELTAACEEDETLEDSITHSIHRLYGAVMPVPTQTII